MREISLFGEDGGHQRVVGALVERLATENGFEVRLRWHNAKGGHGQVADRLRRHLRDLEEQDVPSPDLIVVAIDANCKGLNERERELKRYKTRAAKVIYATPDPHVERWLLLDGAAFKSVYGRGCDAPDQKCDRHRYKRNLAEAILSSGNIPELGGFGLAREVVQELDIERTSRLDRSFKRFVDSYQAVLREWQR